MADRVRGIRLILGVLFIFGQSLIISVEAKVHRYFPKFSAATKVYVIRAKNLSAEEGLLIQSLMGLLARNSAPGERIYLSLDRPQDELWFKEIQALGITVDTTTYSSSPWGLLDYFKEKVEGLNGYLKFDIDNESANVVAPLAGIYQCLAVDAKLESEVKKRGIDNYVAGPGAGDVNQLTEGEAFEVFQDKYAPGILFEQRCLSDGVGRNSLFSSRDYSVATNGFMFWHGIVNNERREFLQLMANDAMKFGYGPGAEWVHVSQASKESVGTLACGGGVVSLALHATIPVPLEELRIRNHVRLRDLSWQDKHYACFIHSDGDSIGWSTDGMITRPDFWANPHRGKFNVGWAPSPNLWEIMPVVQRYLTRTATNKSSDGKRGSGSGTRDGFFIDSGHSYIYPDIYGIDDWGEIPNPSLANHAERLASTMRQIALNVVWFMVLERKNYTRTEYLQPFVDKYDRLLGILMKTYHGAYKEHANHLYWLTSPTNQDIPIEYVDYSLWENYDSTTTIADALNQGSTDPATKEAYSLIVCHCWSLGTMDNINSIIEGLNDRACVVTPEEYCMLIRLRLQPEQTLKNWLKRVGFKLDELDGLVPPDSRDLKAKDKARDKYKTASEYYKQSDYQNCFNAAKKADKLTELARLSYLKLNRLDSTLRVQGTPNPSSPLYYYHITELDPSALPVKQYQIQIAPTNDFSKPTIDEYFCKRNYILPSEKQKYWVRVRAQGRCGDWGEWVVKEIR